MSIIRISLFTLLVTVSGSWAAALECCPRCGCHDNVRKVCTWKEEIKKVPVTTYECVTEDFCMPRPSAKGDFVTEIDEKGCERCKQERVPTCGKVYTRTKLVKKTTEKEQKVYKWVVEYVCDDCKCCVSAQGNPGGPVSADSPNVLPTGLTPPKPFSLPFVADRRAKSPNPPEPPSVRLAPPLEMR